MNKRLENTTIMTLEKQIDHKKNIRTGANQFLFIYMIIIMLCTGGMINDTCQAASSPGEIRVGSEMDFPPYAFTDEKGQVTGFSIELIKAVTDAMGLSIKISTGTWDSVWSSLKAGRLDVLPIVARLPERQRLVDFSLPHTETYDAFFVRKGDPPLPNIAAAKGKAIVVMRSDAAHHELLETNFQGQLIIVDTIPTGLSLIASGKHDAFLGAKLIGTLLLKKQGITGLVVGPAIPDYKRVFSFAVKKGETELLEKLNQGLLVVKSNGEYDRIYSKWLTIHDPWQKTKRYFLPVIIFVIVIALIALFWLVMLQQLVTKRTRELAEKNELLRQAHDTLEINVQERTMELGQSNQLLQTEIIERKRVETALRESEGRYALTLDAVNDGLWDWHVPSGSAFFNPRYYSMLGYDDGEFPANYASWRLLVHPQDLDRVEAELRLSIDNGKGFAIDLRMKLKAGGWQWVSTRGKVVERDAEGKALRMVGILSDITDRRKSEEKIQASLREKELLLKEIHHRVKNNLQIISSLLKMQGRYVGDEKLDDIFGECQDRIRAMATVHTMLYRSQNFAEINFGDYIRETAGQLFRLYKKSTAAISLVIHAENVMLSIDAAIPCGLIINELVTNALKYAFPEGVTGELRIEMEQAENGARLLVRDNGIGFPPDMDFRNTETLGLKLVTMLVEQLDGTIEQVLKGGTGYVILFTPQSSSQGVQYV